MNRVKLYSNGTGVFDRTYVLRDGEPLRVSIPIRNDSLDEAVASIGVFGNVALKEPPSYTPLGTNRTDLEIEPTDVVRDLATRLRGARVTLKVAAETVSGRLAGIQAFQETTGETVIERFRIALFDEQGALRTFADREIMALTFTESSVQEEIDKALQRAFETIKPNSTFVNLTLAPNDGSETEATIQYAVAQLGAWKISYRLRCLNGAWELEGQAVVDNSTDEPWDDFLVSVVTGQPISFSTDLAEIRPVQRSRVNVVANQALGAVTLEEAVPTFDMDSLKAQSAPQLAAMSGVVAPAGRMAFRAASAGAPRGYPNDLGLAGEDTLARYGAPAQQERAEVRDVGDAVEYTSPYPVSIGANKSAIIPLFSFGLKEAVAILVYKRERHPERPYRAIRLKNEVDHSLGRGVCTLFQEGAYVGKAILDATEPKQERTLPYALESGVRVFAESKRRESRRAGVRISKGVALCEVVNRARVLYKVQNNKAEDFRLEIEHQRELTDSTFQVEVAPKGEAETTDIPSGTRIALPLPAHAKVGVTVTETQIAKQRISLEGVGGTHWLHTNIVDLHNPLESDPALQNCFQLQAAVDRAGRDLADVEQQVTDLLDEQERLKGLLKAGGHEGAANEWRTTLAENEKRIKAIKTQTIPQLRQAVHRAEEALQAALNTLTLTWRETS